MICLCVYSFQVSILMHYYQFLVFKRFITYSANLLVLLLLTSIIYLYILGNSFDSLAKPQKQSSMKNDFLFIFLWIHITNIKYKKQENRFCSFQCLLLLFSSTFFCQRHCTYFHTIRLNISNLN